MPNITDKENQAVRQKASYNGIDLVKFLCAVLVVAAHVLPFRGELTPMQAAINYGVKNYLARLIVPFYFICSGYFLFRKMSRDALKVDVIRDYCFRLLRLSGTWYLLLIVGGNFHLWFLGETAIAVAVVSLCFHWKLRPRNIWILALVLYAIGLLGESYYGLLALYEQIPLVRGLKWVYDHVLTITRNGLFYGFVFVLMGATLAWKPVTMKPGKAFAGFAVSMALLLAEAFVLKYFEIPREYSLYIFALPVGYFLFAFAFCVKLKDHPIYKRLRRIGFLMYVSHLVVVWAVDLLFGALTGSSAPLVVVLISALAVAAGLEKLSEKKGFGWINWLLG